MPALLHLEALEIRLAVCRLDADRDVPRWVAESREFSSITRTIDELSIVCDFDVVPEGVPMEGPWRAFRVKGQIVMTLIGIVVALANPLAAAGISIFAISTFDTDYILVHEPDFDAAVSRLTLAGHVVVSSQGPVGSETLDFRDGRQTPEAYRPPEARIARATAQTRAVPVRERSRPCRS
jgi:hypothetical protein